MFGEKGACGNCWCMFFRRNKKDFDEGKKNGGNKKKKKKKNMKKIVWSNKPAGVFGFYAGKPIAWCTFAPREDFIRLEKSRVHKGIDNEPVWSLPCLFIEKEFRRKGVSVELLKAVIKYAKQKKIKIIEAYPIDLKKKTLPDPFVY